MATSDPEFETKFNRQSANKADLHQVEKLLYPTESQVLHRRAAVTLISIDVEFNSQSHDIDQVGISTLAASALSKSDYESDSNDCRSTASITSQLFLLKRDCIPRNTYTRQYLYGTAQRTYRAELSAVLTEALRPTGKSEVILIGHNISSDIRVIKEYCGLDLKALPCITKVVDTAYLTSHVFELQSRQASLKHACRLVGILARQLHNAGNDAYYTLKLFILLFRLHKQQDILHIPDLTETARVLWGKRFEILDRIGKENERVRWTPKKIQCLRKDWQLEQCHEIEEAEIGLAALNLTDSE